MDFFPVTLFKYYVIGLGGGGGSRPSMILMTQGGFQNLGKPDDVILERSLMSAPAEPGISSIIYFEKKNLKFSLESPILID